MREREREEVTFLFTEATTSVGVMLLRCFGIAAVVASGVGIDLFRVHSLIVVATLNECIMSD